MSVAVEFAPGVYLPEPACPPARLATVHTLHPPAPRSVAPALRLTRRGVLVLATAVAALAIGLVALAVASAPGSAAAGGAGAGVAGSVPATVTVRAGDTLWSIAGRVAPGVDPRAEVAVLQRLNHLSGAQLRPGQVLATR